MTAGLFILSIILFVLSCALNYIANSGAYGFNESVVRREAHVTFLASVIVFSAAAVVGAVEKATKDLEQKVGKELAKRFPRTPLEKMMAFYERNKEEGKDA